MVLICSYGSLGEIRAMVAGRLELGGDLMHAKEVKERLGEFIVSGDVRDGEICGFEVVKCILESSNVCGRGFRGHRLSVDVVVEYSYEEVLITSA